jgi:hypothetical protein
LRQKLINRPTDKTKHNIVWRDEPFSLRGSNEAWRDDREIDK